MDNDIWILCDLPSNKKPTKCKWVYKLKLKFDGTIDHYKNCLIVKGPIAWVSHKQQCTVRSTTKIEYVDDIMATKEVVWLCHLFANLGYSQSTPTMFLLNNQNAIQLGSNPKFHCPTKHIDIQYHIIC
ncbi:hypothetical protein BDL97_05G120700 [Sphagnum fallax]|nr:hypothetical protein BDL97_05G120700 [Sphagnum fallax]